MTHNIEVESGKTVKLPTAGKYCDRDIVVTGYGSNEADLEAKYTEGKQAEYDAFWDVLQNNGNPANYHYKFGYNTGTAGWTDENFNPKYPIICTTGTTAGMNLFYANAAITDTKVPIEVQGSAAQGIFYNASKLVTIRKLTVHSGVTFQSSFQNCTALEHITMSGTIGQDFDIHWSTKLTKASITSIINALSPTASGKTVTFSQAAMNKAFETSEGANDGLNSEEAKALRNTRLNWTFTMV